MATVIQAAARGERGAMQSLYKANKQKIWSIAYGLLLDQKQAASVTVAVFQDMWREVKQANVTSKEEFTIAAVNKTAEMCAATILQKNPKAFQIPHDKSFELPSQIAIKQDFQTEPEFYLSNLPALQRLIFVLHTVGNWGALRISRVLRWDPAIVRSAIETEPDTFSRLQNLSGRAYYDDYENILRMFVQWEMENVVPESVEQQIFETMASLVSTRAEQAKRRKLSIFVFCAVVVLGLLAVILRTVDFSSDKADEPTETVSAVEDEENETLPAPEDTTRDPEAPYDPPSLDSDVIYYAEIEVEEYGTILIRLDQEAAPITCANFVELAEMGYYDFLTIYGTDNGSKVCGGDPSHGGVLSSDRRICGEFSANGYDNPLSMTAGAIYMERNSDYDSAHSIFSILTTDRTDLDGQYAVFGYVIEGMDVVEEISNNIYTDEEGNLDVDSLPVIFSLYIIEEDIEEPIYD